MKIQKAVRDRIIAHAKKIAPIEACGYLASKDGVVCKHYELTNVDRAEDHFTFDPKEQFATMKDARANDLVLNACYHSHPVSPARPSKEDIRLAYDPAISYVIISLENGGEDVKSYKIKGSKVENDPIKVV